MTDQTPISPESNALIVRELNVGEPRRELPEPEVARVVNGALPADTPGTTLTVVYLNTVKGDKVTYEWVGSKTGSATDSLELSSVTAGKPLPFNIKAELIKGNDGGTVVASYFIERAAGGTSRSNELKFSVGEALNLTFTNEPYTIGPAGWITTELLLSTSSDNPVPGGKLSLTLPADFTYLDGGSGQRDFITDDVGRVSVGFRGTLIPGPYSLRATSDNQTATATITVAGLGIPVGDGPQYVAVNPEGTRAYVGNVISRTVSVIDTTTNRVLTHISVGNGPEGITVSPDGTRVYVCNAHGNTVSVIDTATYQVLTTIQVEGSPRRIAINPTGTRAYACNFASETVSVIDTATDHVLTNIPVPDKPYSIAISPDGTRAYICGFNAYLFLVIDTATNQVLKSIPIGSAPWGIAVSPDGIHAYVCVDDGKVLVIDTATELVLTDIPVRAAHGIAVSPDGTRVYVSGYGYSTFSVIDTATNQLLRSISVSTNPYGVAVSPDGARAFICHPPGRMVSVIDTATIES